MRHTRRTASLLPLPIIRLISMMIMRLQARSPLLGKSTRGVTRVPPLILSADVHDQGFRSLRLDLESGDQGIFRIHDGVAGSPL
jgi:hypothetical protein